MKLFLIDVKFKKRPRSGRQVVVHAKTKAAAETHVGARYPGCELLKTIELPNVPKHFVVYDLDL